MLPPPPADPIPGAGLPLAPAPASWRRRLRRLRARVLLRRRPLAVLLVVVAVLAGARATAAPPPPTVPVLVAARDLAGGAPLRDADLRLTRFPAEAVPDGASTAAADALGRTLAAPLRAGEPVTDVRLVTPDLLVGYPGLVAVPVRVTDPGAVALLAVGDPVDLVATDPGTGRARMVAQGAPVVALPRAGGEDAEGAGPGDSTAGSLVQGALVVVAVPPADALALTGRAATHLLSVVLSR